MIRFLALFALVIGFACANTTYAQCNSGQNNSQVQAQLTANQALALQQAAIQTASRASVQQTVIQPQRTVSTIPVGLTQLAAAPACSTCSQASPQVATARPAAAPQLVLTAPGSNKPVPPGRYVMATAPAPGIKLARN